MSVGAPHPLICSPRSREAWRPVPGVGAQIRIASIITGPGQARPRLSDQFITSEHRARRTGSGTSGTAALPPPKGPRCTAPGDRASQEGSFSFRGGPAGLGSRPDQIRSRCRRGRGSGAGARTRLARPTLAHTHVHSHARPARACQATPQLNTHNPTRGRTLSREGRKSAPYFKPSAPGPKYSGRNHRARTSHTSW